MNSRCPLRRPIIAGSRAWASWIGARRLTSSARSISAAVKPSRRPLAGSAALAMRMSTAPASSTRRSSSAGTLRSTTVVRASSSVPSCASTSARRPVRISLAPRAERARAIASPIPPVAPVTSTVDPWICTSCEPIPMRTIALFGPTGVGKTAVAVALAELLRGGGEDPVAVSADALQVYAGLEILTGSASPAERALLEHRLVSFLPLDATFSVGQYAELVHAEIDGLLAVGRRPVVVGGTGLYLRAALTELSLRPPPPEGVRERWRAELDRHGAPALHARLSERAPWAAQSIDANDSQRVVRALELLDLGELEPPGGTSQLWSAELRHPTLLAGLTMHRDELYAAIDARIEAMLAGGVREEVLRARAAGASETARKALGYEELLDGDVERMKRRTRNYAKRQLTWMRKLAGVRIIDVSGRDQAAVAREILDSGAP